MLYEVITYNKSKQYINCKCGNTILITKDNPTGKCVNIGCSRYGYNQPNEESYVITSYSIHYTKLYEDVYNENDKCSLPKMLSESKYNVYQKKSTDENSRDQVKNTRTSQNIGMDIKKILFGNGARNEGETRITSYNVCYTKLLRNSPAKTVTKLNHKGSMPYANFKTKGTIIVLATIGGMAASHLYWRRW